MRVKRTIATLAAALLVTGGGAVSASAAPVAPAEVAERLAAAQAEPVDVGILATDAPRAIRVGAAVVPLNVTVQTGQPMDGLVVGVVGPDDADATDEEEITLVGYGEALPVAGRPNVFKPLVEVYAEDLEGWGEHAFVFAAGRDADDVVATGVALTEVKAHSLLGLSATRSGSTTQVRGSARAYHSVQDRYVPWSGRPVSVQRWDGAAWVQVTGATTDARGNFSSSVRVPAGSQLRLVVKDAATIWGAVSGTATV